MQVYQCVMCNHYYTEKATTYKSVSFEQVPDIMVCKQSNCPGQGISGLCIPVPKSVQEIVDGNTQPNVGVPHQPVQPVITRSLGLCVFLMDASGSMGENAFGDSSLPADPAINKTHSNNSPVEKAGQMSKRVMVALAAATGIFGLKDLSNKQDAYICVILYDHRTKYLFYKSLQDIFREYATAEALAAYLLDELKGMNGGTNINQALRLAYDLVRQFNEGNIDALGSFGPVVQNVPQNYDIHSGQTLSSIKTLSNVPNIRTLLYTDGEHQAEYGALSNPFGQFEPDPLINIYIGQAGTGGARELRHISHKCPIHGQDQFLAVSQPQDMASLHGIFRMASGQSGYCLKCLLEAQKQQSDY